MHDFFNQIISYHDLINGPLVQDKLNANKIADHLNSEQLDCKDMILGKFKRVNKKHTLIEELRVSTIHPLADEYFQSSEINFSNSPVNIIDSDVFKLLKLNSEKIQNDYFYKKNKSVDIVGVALESEWYELDANRLMYGYVNVQLQEMETKYINTIRQLAMIKPEDVFRKGIIKIQRIFNSYLNEIIYEHKLKPSDLQLKVKTKYCKKDCSVLVYQSIIRVLDFISTTFYDFLDLNQQIPYYSQLLNENHFVATSKQIIKNLKQIDLDERLVAIIHSELNKVLSIDVSNRINYFEFDFYNGFLNSFNSFLKKQRYAPLDQEAIIFFLISNNLKKKSFFDFLIDDIAHQMSKLEDFEEKRGLLFKKRKEFQQALLNAELYVNVDENHLTHKLLKYINIELEYLKEPILINSTLSKTDSLKFKKLTTSLNTKEIAIFCRLFKEVGVLNEETISSIAKWVPYAIKNNISKFHSHASIRNKMYDIDDKSYMNVRSLLLKMYNFNPDDFGV